VEQSIYRIEVGISSPSNESLRRAQEIIDKLKEDHEVTEDEGGWWVTFLDFDTREDAIKALRMTLDRLAPDWQEFLIVG
jgi:hypothetical protein